MNKIVKIFYFISLLLTLSLISCEKKVENINYETYTVKKKNLEVLVTETGEIGSELERSILAPFTTKLDEVLLEGSMVKKGDSIGKLSTTNEEKEVEKAQLSTKEAYFDTKISEINNKKEKFRLETELENAKLELKIAEIKKKKLIINKDRIGITTAEENLKTINIQLEISTLELKEKEKLYKLGYLSEEDLNQTKTKVEELNQKKKYTLVNQNVLKKGAFKEEIEKETININLAKENLSRSQKDFEKFNKTSEFSLADSNIRMSKSKEKYDYYKAVVSSGNLISPLTGLLVYGKMNVGAEEVKIKAGDSIREGTTIAKVYDINKPILKLMINEVDITKIKLGEKVKFTLDSYPEKTFTGVISFIAPIATKKFEEDLNNISVFNIEVKINEIDKLLKPGMTANAEIIAENYDSILVIPSSAIIKENNQSFCFIKKENKIIKQAIITGVSNDLETEVKKGLMENDLVVLSPI
ncbi:MAG: HlyD family efflux transporter periplasmic adaptor subunit [Candidatus Sericytochromatia bacterium]